VHFGDVDMGAKPDFAKSWRIVSKGKNFEDFPQRCLIKIGVSFDAVSIATPAFSHFLPQCVPCPLVNMSMSRRSQWLGLSRSRLMMGCCQKISKPATQIGKSGPSEANYFQFKAWKDAESSRCNRNDRP